MYKQLAIDIDIKSYRQLDTLSVDSSKKGKNAASWLNKKVSSSLMDKLTAQLTPREFTEKLCLAAIENGLEILADTVVDITAIDIIDNKKNMISDTDYIMNISTLHNGIISANAVIICMGPWSGKIIRYLRTVYIIIYSS